jgi:hypothetical protein
MMSSPSGTFTLTLRVPKRFNIRKEIRNGDWISIWWQRGGDKFAGMLGNIDGVRRSRSVNEGATTETWVVTGRDIGKVFEKAEVWFNEYVQFGSNVSGRIFGNRIGYVPGGAPDRVVENIIDAFIGGSGNVGGAWRWPMGLRDKLGAFMADGLLMAVEGTMSDLTGGVRSSKFKVGKNKRLEVSAAAFDALAAANNFASTEPPLLRGELIDENSLFQPQPGTKLHDMLTRWSNPLLNELFYDIVSDGFAVPEEPQPLVVCRERPFVNAIGGMGSPWFNLPTVRVSRQECGPDDLGSNDEERVNLIMLYARSSTMTQMDQYAVYPPAIDQDDAAAYGLRRWEREIDFAGIGSTGDGRSWNDEIRLWEQLIQSWYGLNHEWLNGTCNFNFVLPEARIGKRLVIQGLADEDTTQAYIEGVALSWRYPSAGQTALSLTRGFVGTDAELVQAVSEKQAQFVRPTNFIPGADVSPVTAAARRLVPR